MQNTSIQQVEFSSLSFYVFASLDYFQGMSCNHCLVQCRELLSFERLINSTELMNSKLNRGLLESVKVAKPIAYQTTGI